MLLVRPGWSWCGSRVVADRAPSAIRLLLATGVGATPNNPSRPGCTCGRPLNRRSTKKAKYRLQVPNVRSWAVGVTESLADLIRVEDLPQIRLNPKETPPDVHVRPVVGGAPEAVMTLEEFRKEWPLLRTAFLWLRSFRLDQSGGGGGSRHRPDVRRAA